MALLKRPEETLRVSVYSAPFLRSHASTFGGQRPYYRPDDVGVVLPAIASRRTGLARLHRDKVKADFAFNDSVLESSEFLLLFHAQALSPLGLIAFGPGAGVRIRRDSSSELPQYFVVNIPIYVGCLERSYRNLAINSTLRCP